MGKLADRIQVLKNSMLPDLHALGVNLEHDHRITQSRARQIEEIDNTSDLSPESTIELLKRYYWRCVKSTTHPHFSDVASNGANLAIDLTQRNSNNRSIVNPFFSKGLLKRIVDFSYVFDPLNTAAMSVSKTNSPLDEQGRLSGADFERQRQLLRSFPNGAAARDPKLRDSSYKAWLKEALIEAPDGIENARVLQYTLWQMNTNEPFNCLWVVPDNFAPAANAEGRRLCESCGGWADEGHIVAVISYPLAAVRQIFRPSQLEAGCQPLHFPSPPDRRLDQGGCVVDVAQQRQGLVPEYIHRNVYVRFSDLRVECIREVGTSSRRDSDSLKSIRRHHYERLCVAHPGTSNWLMPSEVLV